MFGLCEGQNIWCFKQCAKSICNKETVASCSFGNSWEKVFIASILTKSKWISTVCAVWILKVWFESESTPKNTAFSSTHTLPIIISCTEDCYTLFTCTSFTAGLWLAAEVHPSSRCEHLTTFTGSLQKYKLVVSVGFSSTSSPCLLLPSYFHIIFYHLHFKEKCLQFFNEPRLILGTKVDKCFLTAFFGQYAHCLQVSI